MAPSPNYNDPLEEYVTVTSVWHFRVMAKRYAAAARKEVLPLLSPSKTLYYKPPRASSYNGYQAECLDTCVTIASLPSSSPYPDW